MQEAIRSLLKKDNFFVTSPERDSVMYENGGSFSKKEVARQDDTRKVHPHQEDIHAGCK